MSMIGNFKKVKKETIRALVEDPETLSDYLYDESGEEEEFDVDKAWQAIHFLLNGDPWQGETPLGKTVLGGVPISDEDVGYGPARFLTPDEVKSVAKELDKISTDELWSRFDAKAFALNEIYPGFEDNKEDREYICGYYQALREYYRKAADDGLAMILYMN